VATATMGGLTVAEREDVVRTVVQTERAVRVVAPKEVWHVILHIQSVRKRKTGKRVSLCLEPKRT